MPEPGFDDATSQGGYRLFLTGVVGLWVSYVVLVAWPVYQAAQHGCFRYYDLGIYAQGIASLQGSDSNPWLSGRQLRLFFDHVDPVVWTAVIWRWALGPLGAALVTETLWIMLSIWPLAALVRHARLTWQTGLLAALVLLYNPTTLAAAQFPVHPTTWAMAPMFACVMALCRRRYMQASLPLAILMACKEEFAWGAAVWGIILVCRDKQTSEDEAPGGRARRRVGRLWMMAACTWLVGVYVLRPLGGHTAPYPTQLFSGMWTQGLDYWIVRLIDPTLWRRAGMAALGIGPLALALGGGRQEEAKPWTPRVLWGLLPCVAIRFLGLAWGYQYDACLGAGLIACIVARCGAQQRPTWASACFVGAGLGAAWGLTGTCADAGAPGAAFGHYGHAATRCEATPQRTEALQQGVASMLKEPEQDILVGQNLAALLAAHPHLYVLGGPQPRAQMRYHYVWVEVPPMGDTWPLDPNTIRAAIALWRATPGVDIVVDDGAMFMARGALPYPDNATFR